METLDLWNLDAILSTPLDDFMLFGDDFPGVDDLNYSSNGTTEAGRVPSSTNNYSFSSNSETSLTQGEKNEALPLRQDPALASPSMSNAHEPSQGLISEAQSSIPSKSETSSLKSTAWSRYSMPECIPCHASSSNYLSACPNTQSQPKIENEPWHLKELNDFSPKPNFGAEPYREFSAARCLSSGCVREKRERITFPKHSSPGNVINKKRGMQFSDKSLMEPGRKPEVGFLVETSSPQIWWSTGGAVLGEGSMMMLGGLKGVNISNHPFFNRKRRLPFTSSFSPQKAARMTLDDGIKLKFR